MSEVKKAVPFVYWANCADPDYSAVCWHREDALTEINDHGGTLYELSHTSELDRVTAERDALQARLTEADERADVLDGLAADVVECLWGLELPGAGNARLRKLRAALKPAEGGCDEAVNEG
ncbi:hypothetical protein [Pseudomonas sp. VB3]|uniref:hypothetical protein n=1 Tax=Pseudomonas sp. VB3 TaxID=2994641 RepID=UPI0022EC59AF|nr:hypothetical protein [Pseudomonas sp. VB3]